MIINKTNRAFNFVAALALTPFLWTNMGCEEQTPALEKINTNPKRKKILKQLNTNPNSKQETSNKDLEAKQELEKIVKDYKLKKVGGEVCSETIYKIIKKTGISGEIKYKYYGIADDITKETEKEREKVIIENMYIDEQIKKAIQHGKAIQTKTIEIYKKNIKFHILNGSNLEKELVDFEKLLKEYGNSLDIEKKLLQACKDYEDEKINGEEFISRTKALNLDNHYLQLRITNDEPNLNGLYDFYEESRNRAFLEIKDKKDLKEASF